jgi:nucleoside 2-deoxyribosyltransferase
VRVYLAGPMAGMSDQACRVWREYAKKQDPSIDWLDPMVRDYRAGWQGVNPAWIVEPDKRDIDSCDAVLAVVEPVSVGTTMEIQHAWLQRIPVIAVAQFPKNVSPWIVYHSYCVVDQVLTGIEQLQRFKK